MSSLRHDVFISCSLEDIDFAKSMERSVRKAGFTTWCDLDAEAAGHRHEGLDSGIKGANAVVVILSPDSVRSQEVTSEWSFALGLGVPLLPIRYNTAWGALHPRLHALQTLDFSNGLPQPWDQLFDKLRELAAAHRPHGILVPRDAPRVVQLAAAVLDSMNEEERQAALETVSEMDDPAAIALLAEAIRHPIEQVRYEAGVALGKRQDPRAVAPVLEAARSGREVEFENLTCIGPPAIPALQTAVLSGQPTERDLAIQALGAIGGPAAFETLAECLRSSDAGIRGQAAEAVGDSRDPAALSILRPVMNDPDATVRRKVARSLGACGGALATEDLVLLLGDSDRDVRNEAGWRLERTPAPAAIPALIQALNDEYDQVAAHAAEALQKIGDPVALPALFHGAVHSPHDNARGYMRRAVETFAAAAGPMLRAASDDPEDATRAATLRFLAKLDDPADLSLFISKSRDRNANVRYYAVEGLSGNLASQALPQLLEAADDPDPKVREQAIGGLGKTRSPTTVTKLIEALRDQSVHAARRAASVLGNLRELRAVPELIECLPDDGVAETASWALLHIGTKRARIEVRAWKQRTKGQRVGMA